ncbi:ThuA domain-containing protein [Rhodococcus triatomae]
MIGLSRRFRIRIRVLAAISAILTAAAVVPGSPVAWAIGSASFGSSGSSGSSEPAASSSILVYTHAAGFVHPSIPAAVQSLSMLSDRETFQMTTTDDPAMFTNEELSKYDALVFVNTTGNILPEESQRDALEHYIRNGGGWLGVHAASDMGSLTEDWPWYRDLVGASFKGHTRAHYWRDGEIGLAGWVYEGLLSEAPADAELFEAAHMRHITWEPALVYNEDPGSAAMRGWPEETIRSDEWYGFQTNPRERAHVLASLDEDSYDAHLGDMGPGAADHPIAWCHGYDGGRSIYTGMGHSAAAWSDPQFLSHVAGSIKMATGTAPFNC